VTTIINLNPYLDRSAERKGSVTTKRGSKKLYVDFYYHGVRIVKSTGLEDNPADVRVVVGTQAEEEPI